MTPTVGKKIVHPAPVAMAGTRTALLLLIILHDTIARESLWCYECGTGVAGEPDCAAFARASSWKAFWRRCPKDYICVKTTSWFATEEGYGLVRGCSPKTNLKGTDHKVGCWGHASTYTVTCFCDSDLCNASYKATPSPTTLVALVALYLVVR